jgi:hypothetical protein
LRQFPVGDVSVRSWAKLLPVVSDSPEK